MQLSQVFIGREISQCDKIPPTCDLLSGKFQIFCVKADEITGNIVQSTRVCRVTWVSHLPFRNIPDLEIYLLTNLGRLHHADETAQNLGIYDQILVLKIVYSLGKFSLWNMSSVQY